MAIVNTNPLVNGLSGMLGRTLVFKTLYGKTIVASRPRPPKTQSESQKANRSKFRDASRWARATLHDPKRKAYYQKKAEKLNLPNAYTAAIADYMRKPIALKVKALTDKPTYTVFKKDFALKQVTAQLNDGTQIPAIAAGPDRWVFEVPADKDIAFSVTGSNDKVTTLPMPT